MLKVKCFRFYPFKGQGKLSYKKKDSALYIIHGYVRESPAPRVIINLQHIFKFQIIVLNVDPSKLDYPMRHDFFLTLSRETKVGKSQFLICLIQCLSPPVPRLAFTVSGGFSSERSTISEWNWGRLFRGFFFGTCQAPRTTGG